MPTLDGKMLYLKALADDELKNVDSCDIVHGKFHFSGKLDSTSFVNLYMDDENIMPLVLEGDGDIQICIDNTQLKVSGTPLNDQLTAFLEKYLQLENEIDELDHIYSQAIMEGEDMDAVNRDLVGRNAKLAEEKEELVPTFIVANFDNVLGAGVFSLFTHLNYPEPSPWLEYLMSKATDNFRNDPYVKEYYRRAQQVQAILNGMAE